MMTSPVGVRFSKKLAAVNSLHSTTAQCTPLQEFHRVCLISIKMYSLWKFVSYCLISYENYAIIYVPCEEGTLQGKGIFHKYFLAGKGTGKGTLQGYLAERGTLQGWVPCRDRYHAGMGSLQGKRHFTCFFAVKLQSREKFLAEKNLGWKCMYRYLTEQSFARKGTLQ